MSRRTSAMIVPLLWLLVRSGGAAPDPPADPAATAVAAQAPAPAAGAVGAERPAPVGPRAPAAEPVDIREWTVPWEDTRPRDPHLRDRSRVWFVGQEGHYVANLDPETGEFERFDLEDGTGPHNLVVDEDGSVWYAGNRAAHIGHLDPATGEIDRIAMPNPEARDPHTLRFDHRGDIWFTVQGGNFVGKLDVSSREVSLLPVPTDDARPYGIVMDGDGRPWVALLGTNKLATVDPDSMVLREVELPRPDAHPRRIGMTSDGAVWYVDYVQGYLGRYEPSTATFDEWRAPAGGEAAPYGMAVDDRDRIWFVETGSQPNRLVGFDPGTEDFFGQTDIPSGGGTVRNMYYFEPSGEIWFGADTNTIGRIAVP